MKSGFAAIHGLNMHYEVEGGGDLVVYLPPAFGFAGLKSLSPLTKNHTVLTVDFQGHGRTADIPDRAMSLEQHAADVVELFKYLGIKKADFFGESYGGAVATILALRHPELVGRVATYGATFGPPESALNMEMLQTKLPLTAESKAFQFQKEKYKKVAPSPEYWPQFWNKVVSIEWRGFSKEELKSIQAPLLIALGDHDFVRLEHAVETFKIIPNAELAVIPSASHFALFSEPERILPIVENFLTRREKKIPLATGETGYSPGESR
jgi:pimeloyl-ACP methyl ester carboxylesterase